jgi:hypothetical protein
MARRGAAWRCALAAASLRAEAERRARAARRPVDGIDGRRSRHESEGGDRGFERMDQDICQVKCHRSSALSPSPFIESRPHVIVYI